VCPLVATSSDQVGTLRSSWRALLRGTTVARLTAQHYVDPVVSWTRAREAVRSYPGYLRDRKAYERLSGEPLSRLLDNPQLFDRTATTPTDPHYTHQDAWAAKAIHDAHPERHVDVGSRITFVVGLTPFVPVTFVDLRPLDVEIPGLEVRAGTVLELPFADRSVESLSCLHVAEHVGLGRYGDPLDPEGTRKAASELERVLAPGGRLLFALPVGEPRTEFNAHRVHHPEEIPGMFPRLRLKSFSGVDDAGRWRRDLTPRDLAASRWGCGFYEFAADDQSIRPS
jgi:SAM-dependent methyltransferase